MGIWERWKRARKDAPGEQPADPDAPSQPEGSAESRGLSAWLEKRAQRAVSEAYEVHAEDLEERARRVMSTAYEKSADDLEERAVRAMRRAIEAEAGRIQEAIEHGIAVKKREVRLSLVVLVVSSLVYLALYWFTRRPEGP